MNSIYNHNSIALLIDRIEKITPETKALWGKMNAAQMLQHCKLATDVAFGKQDLKINFLMKILGRLLKKKVFYGSGLQKNSPTAKEFIVNYNVDFEKAKQDLIHNLNRFANEGTASIKVINHPFWGKLSYEDWDALLWKHTNHHLEQFGV
jgi:hypothetical protein